MGTRPNGGRLLGLVVAYLFTTPARLFRPMDSLLTFFATISRTENPILPPVCSPLLAPIGPDGINRIGFFVFWYRQSSAQMQRLLPSHTAIMWHAEEDEGKVQRQEEFPTEILVSR